VKTPGITLVAPGIFAIIFILINYKN